jgi:murein DD-endopeptidase MepM/ murein hydrolase activator NlpD
MERRSKLNIPIASQPAPQSAHPKQRMKKHWKSLAILAGVIVLLGVTGIASVLADTIVFYARVARLYSQTPESKISMPFTNIRKQQIADTWQAPRGTDRRHQGQDIFAPKGTPILSATSGYVYKIGDNSLGGQTVSVIGAGGRVYYYAHLDAYAPNLEVGDPVTTRTVLGYVGTTGNAQGTPPHLHFGIYTTSGAINPLPLLKDRVDSNATQTRPATTPTPRRLVTRRV